MGIQQLRRPNVTQFWPPTLLSGQNGHFTWYILFRGTSILGWRLGVGCQIGVQGPQLYVKPRHFCKLDVATSRIAFFNLKLHNYYVLQVSTSNLKNWGHSVLRSKLNLWHPLNWRYLQYYLPFVTWPLSDFVLTPHTPLLVHVVIECPRIRFSKAQFLESVRVGLSKQLSWSLAFV